MQTNEGLNYTEFKSLILQRTGIDLSLYKHQQMHRRILTMVERARAADFVEYFELLESDQAELTLFLDRLTINVSEFFRDPDRWDHLKSQVLPDLWRGRPDLRVWSAGCANGAETYSLALLLAELKGVHDLLGTDIDCRMVSQAEAGVFRESDLRNVSASQLARSFVAASAAPAGVVGQMQLCPDIRCLAAFHVHNLLRDRFGCDHDLICCRNVVIYFTEEAKEVLFDRFYSALRPGGVLFLGNTERIFRYRDIGYELLSPGFYRRPA